MKHDNMKMKNTNSYKLQFITGKGIEKKFKNCLIMFTFNLERCSTCSVVAHVLLLFILLRDLPTISTKLQSDHSIFPGCDRRCMFVRTVSGPFERTSQMMPSSFDTAFQMVRIALVAMVVVHDVVCVFPFGKTGH